MANKIEYEISARDKFSRSIVQIQGRMKELDKQAEKAEISVSNLGQAFKAVFAGATAAAVFRGMDAALRAYGDQQKAINDLTLAMKNQGTFSRRGIQDQLDYATALQRTTTFADEQITAGQALLASFGLQGESLKKATAASLDMASALDIDLKSAMMIVGKAAVGETGTLSRYGIVISDNVPKAQRFDAVLAQLNSRFGGSATAATATYQGKLEQLKNSFGELAEVIGRELQPVADTWTGWLRAAAERTNELTGAASNEAKGRELTIQNLEKQKTGIQETVKLYADRGVKESQILTVLKERLATIEKAIAREKEWLAAETARADAQANTNARGRQLTEEETEARTFAAQQILKTELDASADKRAQMQLEQAARLEDFQKKVQDEASLAEYKKAQAKDLAAFDRKVEAEKTQNARAAAKARMAINLSLAGQLIHNAAAVFDKSKGLALAEIALAKSVAIANAIAAAAKAGPFAKVLAAANIALIVGSFAKEANAVTNAKVSSSTAGLSGGSFESSGRESAVSSGGGSSGAAPLGSPAAGSRQQTVYINVQGGPINLAFDRLDTSNVKQVAKDLGDLVVARDVEAFRLALRLDRAAAEQADLAA